MGRINFNVDAVAMEDVVRQLDNVGNLGRHANAALLAGANVVLPVAKDLAPVRTGKLKESIKIGKRSSSRSTYSIEVGSFHNDAPHAHLVEHGHGGPKPAPEHPFLQPAIDQTEDAVTDAIMAELMKGLE